MGRTMRWFLFLAAAMMLASPRLALAQEEGVPEDTVQEEVALEDEGTDEGQEAIGIEEDIAVTFGTVTSVADGAITILEYDFDADQDVEVTYVIDEDTEYENITAASELQMDDPVEIVFIEMEEQKFALIVKKEDLTLEDEPLAEDEGGEAEEEMLQDVPAEQEG